jgi:ribosomal protein S18 acetylase RimI-like enzyme
MNRPWQGEAMAHTNRPVHLLDNAIWHALNTTHARFAEGDDLARRYPVAMCPLAAIASPSPAAYRRLAGLVQPGGVAALVSDVPPAAPEGWTLIWALELAQMVADSFHPAGKSHSFVELGQGDVPAMMELCTLTRPGPFGPRTHELGTYLGVKVEGALVAMGGERMRLPGFTEISAVCTHPEHRGRGYAQALVTELARQIKKRGETPFLHVKTDNTDAIHVYEKLGFHTRRHAHLAVMRADARVEPATPAPIG